MHEHNHDHIPPPDPHRQKRMLGLKPHHLIGGLVLIAILLIYLLLLVRRGVWVPEKQSPASTASYGPQPNTRLTGELLLSVILG
jgi:hypothetical protein